MSPSFANKIAYAEGLQKSGKFKEALEIYLPLSDGTNGEDPAIWEGVAHAWFQLGEYEKVPAAIEKMRQNREKRRPDEFDLLLPRTLHKLGKLEEAEKRIQGVGRSIQRRRSPMPICTFPKGNREDNRSPCYLSGNYSPCQSLSTLL